MRSMKHVLAMILMLATIALTSCDPGYALLIYNRSKKAHNITVIYDASYASSYARAGKYANTCYKNYITISSLDSTKSTLLHKDSLSANWTTTYSFTLPAKSKVLMEHGLGVAPPYQDIIIDGRDTANTLKRKGPVYRIRKHPQIISGGEYSLTINE